MTTRTSLTDVCRQISLFCMAAPPTAVIPRNWTSQNSGSFAAAQPVIDNRGNGAITDVDPKTRKGGVAAQ